MRRVLTGQINGPSCLPPLQASSIFPCQAKCHCPISCHGTSPFFFQCAARGGLSKMQDFGLSCSSRFPAFHIPSHSCLGLNSLMTTGAPPHLSLAVAPNFFLRIPVSRNRDEVELGGKCCQWNIFVTQDIHYT